MYEVKVVYIRGMYEVKAVCRGMYVVKELVYIDGAVMVLGL